MSDHSRQTGAADQNTPLFQNIDEQEQAYAPQQIPGNMDPAIDEQGSNLGRAGIDAPDGAPVIPMMPAMGSSMNSVPIPSPAAPDALDDPAKEDKIR